MRFGQRIIFALASLVILCGSGITAQDTSEPLVNPRAPDQAKSISDFLTPDGRFDLEAARRSGYQGPLDMGGFRSAIDPSTGQPQFRPWGMAATASEIAVSNISRGGSPRNSPATNTMIQIAKMA